MSGMADDALVIKAKGGLGNRMLSGVTGLVLAKLMGRTPYIDWRDGMYVPPGENLYPLLFDARWMDDLAAYDDSTDVAPALWSGRMTKHPTDIIHADFPNSHQDPLIYRKLSVDLDGQSPPEVVAVFWSYISKLHRLKRRMKAHPEFSNTSVDDVASDFLEQYFRPVPEVNEAVDAIFAGNDRPVIGAHLRFTDRKVSPARILRPLERLKRLNPHARLFLATDSGEAQATVLDRFPDAITISKALAEEGSALHVASSQFTDPVAEARNALVDMLALARCDWLVHSRHSTFSVTAALMGRIAKSHQIDVDRFNAKVRLKQFIQARA